MFPPRDFKSLASASSATAAKIRTNEVLKLLLSYNKCAEKSMLRAGSAAAGLKCAYLIKNGRKSGAEFGSGALAGAPAAW